MFHDSLIAVMAMLLLCFSGMLLMFVFIVRAVSSLNEAQKESFHKQQLYLAQIEQQCIDLKGTLQILRKKMADNEEKQEENLLLRLHDPLEAMLETAASPRTSIQDPEPAMHHLAFLSKEEEEADESLPDISPRPVPTDHREIIAHEEEDEDLPEVRPMSPSRALAKEEYIDDSREVSEGTVAAMPELGVDDSGFVPTWNEEKNVRAPLTAFEAPGREILAGFGPSSRYDAPAAPLEERMPTQKLPDIGELPSSRDLSFRKEHVAGSGPAASFNNEESWLQMVDPHSQQRNAGKQPWTGQVADFGLENRGNGSSRFEAYVTAGQSFESESRTEASSDKEEALDPAVVDRSLRSHVDRVLQEAANGILPHDRLSPGKEVDAPEYKVDAFFDDSDYEDEYGPKPGHPAFPSPVKREVSNSDDSEYSTPDSDHDGESALDKYASRFLSDREDPFHTKKSKSKDKKAKGKKKLSLRRGSFSVDQDE